ncbi:MAG: L-rhamnose/proton symporter RhaT [Planctomycetota bacterium]|jgi:L-rhamnose-H+ transport protein
MAALGLFLIALGGFAAGSFYIPFKKVRNWAWESYWIVNGFFSWIIMPWVIAFMTVPELMAVLREAPANSILHCYLLGLLWGIGGLTFGLSMRYLGMSLGYAIALGFCAAFGTIIPPIYEGTFGNLVTEVSGLTTLAGVFVCLAGIAICGWAGVCKEKELSDEEKKETIKEFNFAKGLLVAIFAGVMSACLEFAFTAGKPIAVLAIDHEALELWQNNPVLIVAFAGGFTTNFIWCVFLNIKNRTAKNYLDSHTPLVTNYIFSAMAGITWYLQFMFYGMGKTKYKFASWSVLMALIIIFSNMWGLIFREWKGTSRRTHRIIFIGIVVLIASIIIVGLGNYLAPVEE